MVYLTVWIIFPAKVGTTIPLPARSIATALYALHFYLNIHPHGLDSAYFWPARGKGIVAPTLVLCDPIKWNESHVGRFSILKLLHHFLKTLTCYMLMQTPLESDILLQSYEQFFNAENNIKLKNVDPFFANFLKTIFVTSDSSFPLIMSHMCCKVSRLNPLIIFFYPHIDVWLLITLTTSNTDLHPF